VQTVAQHKKRAFRDDLNTDTDRNCDWYRNDLNLDIIYDIDFDYRPAGALRCNVPPESGL